MCYSGQGHCSLKTPPLRSQKLPSGGEYLRLLSHHCFCPNVSSALINSSKAINYEHQKSVKKLSYLNNTVAQLVTIRGVIDCK